MKFTPTAVALASLASAAYGQSSSAAAATSTGAATTGNSSDFTTGLAAALTAANLTTLAQVLGAFPQVAQTFQSGGNFTVFAPSNEALSPLLANPAALNLTEVMGTLMYHISPMTLPASALGVGMNHTIAPSLLQEPLLGGNNTAPLVLSIGMDGQPRVRTATQNATVYLNTTYQNVLIHAIDTVLMTPANLTATASAGNLTSLASALTAVSADLPATLDNTPRLTVFAPNNAAFAAVQSVASTLNVTQIGNVLENHIINGTVVYSTMISANTTAVSAAGETISFQIMNGTVYVMSGNTTMARVIRTDIPITNGVVHIIESVLANTMSNASAAMAAESSYAQAATASPSATAGIAGAAAGATGAGYQTMVAGTTLAAAVLGAAFAVIA